MSGAASIYSPAVESAIDRGNAILRENVILLETGSALEIALADWMRDAEFKMNLVRARVQSLIWWEENGHKFYSKAGHLIEAHWSVKPKAAS